MALLRTWSALLVASILSLVVVALVCRSMRPRATYSLEMLHEDETDNETQHTYKSVSFQEDRDKESAVGKDLKDSNAPVDTPETLYEQETDGETQQADNSVSSQEDRDKGRVNNENRRKDSDAQVDTVDAMHQRLAVLTAFSSNHFAEALDMIGSMQTYFPHSKIIAYDIGLAPEERGNVSEFCNVELRSFNFSKYPPHVKMNINNYSWKPLITQELVDQGYDVIFFGDSSLRIIADITPGLQCLLEFPFLDMKMESHSTISVTHDKMIEYFHFPPSRKYMAHWATIQSGGWLLYVNNITREKLIPQWTDCALHKECIAPEGAVKEPCNFALNARNDGTYVGCHRYDQSALDIILAKNFGLNV